MLPEIFILGRSSLYKRFSRVWKRHWSNVSCRQKLCPALIGILANPLADKTVVAPQRSTGVGGDEVGRGSGCSSTAPNVLSGSAKTIYRWVEPFTPERNHVKYSRIRIRIFV